MAKRVYLVTSTELGWDNVVGAFDTDKVSYRELIAQFPDRDGYVISDLLVQSDLDEYE